MKIVVTGASGFVGSALCPRLRRAGHEVVPLSRQPSPGIVGVGDILEVDWDNYLSGAEVVVHLASRAHKLDGPSENAYREYHRINVDGAKRLGEAAGRVGVRRLVYVSSVKVNGERSQTPYTEMDDPQPEDAYGRTKWKAEQVLGRICSDYAVELVVVRPPLVYGPGVKANFRTLIGAIDRNIPLPFGLIDNRRSLIGLGNLCDFLELACVAPDAASNTFLISDEHDISTPDLVRQIGIALGKRPRLIPLPLFLLRGGANVVGKKEALEKLLSSLQVDSSFARTTLGWRPRIAVEEEMRATIEEYKFKKEAP